MSHETPRITEKLIDVARTTIFGLCILAFCIFSVLMYSLHALRTDYQSDIQIDNSELSKPILSQLSPLLNTLSVLSKELETDKSISRDKIRDLIQASDLLTGNQSNIGIIWGNAIESPEYSQKLLFDVINAKSDYQGEIYNYSDSNSIKIETLLDIKDQKISVVDRNLLKIDQLSEKKLLLYKISDQFWPKREFNQPVPKYIFSGIPIQEGTLSDIENRISNINLIIGAKTTPLLFQPNSSIIKPTYKTYDVNGFDGQIKIGISTVPQVKFYKSKWLYLIVLSLIGFMANLGLLFYFHTNRESISFIEKSFRKMDQDLKIRSNQMQAFIENAPFGLTLTTPNGKSFTTNKKFKQIFELTENENPSHWIDKVSVEMRDNVKKSVSQAIRDEKNIEIKFNITTLTGASKVIELRMIPLNVSGTNTNYMGVAHELSSSITSEPIKNTQTKEEIKEELINESKVNAINDFEEEIKRLLSILDRKIKQISTITPSNKKKREYKGYFNFGVKKDSTRKKALIISKNIDCIKRTSKNLNALGFEAIQMSKRKQISRFLKNEDVNLVLLDYSLHPEDGYQSLVNTISSSLVPCVVLSEKVKTKKRNKSVIAVLPKNYTIQNLKKVIETL